MSEEGSGDVVISGIGSRQDEGLLDSLGIPLADERVYVLLLSRDGADVAELANLTRRSRRAIACSLDSLEEKGLITRSPDPARRYFAVPPDIGVEALIERRQSEIHHARSSIQRLREFAAGTGHRGFDDRLVEVLSPEALVSTVPQMVRSAQVEMLCLERPPLLTHPKARVGAHVVPRKPHVGTRAVTDTELLRLPGMMENMRAEMEAGEQHRLCSNLPFKLLIVDRRLAIVPLSMETANGPSLLVRSSSLLTALCELFEMFWRSATPVLFDEAGNLRPQVIVDVAGGGDARLLSLLALGFNDKAIEHDLQMSKRTFTRRVASLMKRLGATTRFHAGWLAARGGVDEPAAASVAEFPAVAAQESGSHPT
jgi:DNA-binding MarR family transcriptional regulator